MAQSGQRGQREQRGQRQQRGQQGQSGEPVMDLGNQSDPTLKQICQLLLDKQDYQSLARLLRVNKRFNTLCSPMLNRFTQFNILILREDSIPMYNINLNNLNACLNALFAKYAKPGNGMTFKLSCLVPNHKMVFFKVFIHTDRFGGKIFAIDDPHKPYYDEIVDLIRVDLNKPGHFAKLVNFLIIKYIEQMGTPEINFSHL